MRVHIVLDFICGSLAFGKQFLVYTAEVFKTARPVRNHFFFRC